MAQSAYSPVATGTRLVALKIRRYQPMPRYEAPHIRHPGAHARRSLRACDST